MQDAADREVLFALVQDREAYQVLLDGRLTLQDFFELFMQSAEIDLSAFVQICQRQKNRPYTIASSSKEDSTRIGICVSLVQEETKPVETVLKELSTKGIEVPRASAYLQKLGACASQPRRFRGLCSEMLCARTTKGEKLWIAARASSFRLPKRTTTPIIMLGAGTGLAPFRGFVREFMAEKGSRSKTVLFFGCTRSDEDFIYKKDMGSPTKSPSPQNGAAGRSKSKMFCHVLLILVFQYDLAVHTSTFVMGSTCCLSGVGGCGAEGASSIEAVGHCLLARAEREDIRTTPTSREFGRGQTDDG